MKTIAAILAVLLLTFQARAQKVSAMPEIYTISGSDLIMVTTPGVNNFKATFLTIASNLNGLITVTATVTNAVASGSNLAVTNSTSFGVFYRVSGLTNMEFFNLKQGTNVVLYRDGSNIVVNASGIGEVTAAQLNTSSNVVVAMLIANDTTTSNGLFSIETTRNAAVSNSVVALELTRNAAVSNALVALIAGSATVAPPLSSIQFNSNGVLQGSSGLVFTNGLIGLGTNIPVARLHVTADNSLLNVFQFGTVTRPSLYTGDTNGNLTGQSIHVTTGFVNRIILTNALGSTEVKIPLEGITNVFITGVVSGDAVIWNGVTWTNASVTSSARFTPVVVSGTGGALTNFNFLATQPELVIAATTNVSIRASMGFDATRHDYWTLTITNGSGANRLLEFSVISNSWRFSGIYGTNLPTVLTNNTKMILAAQQQGSNVAVGYSFWQWP